MNPLERSVQVGGEPCRVWEKGAGEPIGYLAGIGGLPRWTPFLDQLAEKRRVIVPSLPGFPGGGSVDKLDDLADWVTTTLDLLEAAGLDGADLIGASIGGMLACEVAAFSRATVRRLMLIAPFGLFDARDPTTDLFARRPDEQPALLSAHPDRLTAQTASPEGEDPLEWTVMLARASQSAARLLWPLGDRGLARRLHRVKSPTLLVWGEHDRVIPRSYGERFAREIPGALPLRVVPGAGHLADFDEPTQVSALISDFLATTR